MAEFKPGDWCTISCYENVDIRHHVILVRDGRLLQETWMMGLDGSMGWDEYPSWVDSDNYEHCEPDQRWIDAGRPGAISTSP